MFPAITAGWVPPTGGMVRPFCSAAWSEPFQPPPASSGLELYVPWGFGCCGKGTAGSWKNIPESLAPCKKRCLFSWAKQIGLHNSRKSGIIRKKPGNNY